MSAHHRGLELLGALLAVLAVSAAASASTVGPAPAGPPSPASCPSAPLVPGQAGQFGSLVAIFQPGPSAGTYCALSDGDTLVGNQIIFGVYTPQAVPGGIVPIAVKEFQLHTVTVATRGANNTSVQQQVTEPYQVTWSNTSVSATAGEAQVFQLTVPSVNQQEQLNLSLLGITLGVAIIVPGAGNAIPSSYPELLLHDFALDIYIAMFFALGVGVATAIRLRARHVDRLWPFGVFGLFVTVAFAGWVYDAFPQSTIPLGNTPEPFLALPAMFGGIYLWLALFPTDASIHKIEFPVADTKNGERTYDERRFRIFRGPDGPEYIGPGGSSAFQRLLGVRTMLDDRVLTPSPYRMAFASFRSIRGDTYAKMFAWAELPGGPKVLDVVPPRTFLFPWRQRTREAIAVYHRDALKGRVPAPDHVGFFLYVSPSRAFAAVVGRQGAVLVESWINGTLHSSKAGIALERLLVAYTQLKTSLKSEAISYGAKIAYALRMAEDVANSPTALQALEDLGTRMEAELLDATQWHQWLEDQVDEKSARPPPKTVPAKPEVILAEVNNPVPPELRRRLAQGPRR